MATVIGYDGNVWLVAVLMMLVLGLAGAVLAATRANLPTLRTGTRPAAPARRNR